MPSICTTRRSRPESSAASHSRSRVLDSATKCREAADFDTPDPAGAGTSPSGSRTARRNFRVETLTTTQRQTQQRGKYRELIGIAEEVVERARRGLRHTRNVRAKDVPSQLALDELRRQIEHYCGLGERVIDQA